MKRGRNERWFAGIAGIVLLLSTLIFGYLGLVANSDERPVTALDLLDDYPDWEISSRYQLAKPWRAPRPMTRGENWLFDMFTPPEVYYDAQSGRFRLTPPTREPDIALVDVPADEPKSGLILHAVERELFPLQLIGFVGEPGNFLGTFENLVTHETLLLRQGAKVDSLKMGVRDFRVEPVTNNIPESMSVRETQAVAVIVEERTGRETILRQGERAYTEALFARVSLAERSGESFTVVEGELVEAGPNPFRIEKIRLAPPEVDVIKEKQPDGVFEPHTLRPPAQKDDPHDEE